MSRQVAKRTVQHSNFFLQMIRIVWMVQPVGKSIFGTTTFFLAHRTKLVGYVYKNCRGRLKYWYFEKCMMAFGCRPMWIISEKKETQPSHTIFPVKSQKVLASIFKIWTGLTCEGSSCRVWVIDRWQKLEIDQSIFLFFKVLIVPLQTTWDGCYMKLILSKGLP